MTTGIKRSLFRLILILFPFFFFILLEFGLRFFHYGTAYPLFIKETINESPLRTCYSMNPGIGRLYFGRDRTDCLFDRFLSEKSDSTVRIFIQGGSTALGFPFNPSGSFSRMLQARLQKVHPNRHIEIINTAMTAVGSPTLLDLSDDIIAMKPDAVLLYAGHNEFYGALGTGSTKKFISVHPALVRLILKLKRLRLWQLLENMQSQAVTAAKGDEPPLMQIMAGDHHIPLDSKKYRDTEKQLRYNLDHLLEKYRKNGIPVFIGNLVENEKDQPPFISPPLKAGSDHASAAALEGIYAEDSTNAFLCFRIGEAYYTSGDFARAREFFRRAGDLDLLKFRAPAAFSRIIAESARKHGAVLVNIDSTFRLHSPQGIIGDELMMDHLHPNIRGYGLIAESFFRGISQTAVLPFPDTVRASGKDSVPAIHQYAVVADAYSIPESDSIYGEYLITKLKARWPYADREPAEDPVRKNYRPAAVPEKIAFQRYVQEIDWYTSMRRMYDYHVKLKEYRRALGVCEVLAQDDRFSAVPYDMAGFVNMQRKDNAGALENYLKAFGLNPSPEYAIKTALTYVRLDRIEEALHILTSSHPQDHQIGKYTDLIRELSEKLKLFSNGSTEYGLLLAAAQIYFQLSLPDKTREMMRKVLEIDPGNELAQAYFRDMRTAE